MVTTDSTTRQIERWVKMETVSVTLSGHTNHVVETAWSSGGKRLVTVSWDDTAMDWDAETGRIRGTSCLMCAASGGSAPLHPVSSASGEGYM